MVSRCRLRNESCLRHRAAPSIVEDHLDFSLADWASILYFSLLDRLNLEKVGRKLAWYALLKGTTSKVTHFVRKLSGLPRVTSKASLPNDLACRPGTIPESYATVV